ncbi:MAG: TonB family protein [Acidobacteriota bacterium]
MQQKDPLTDDSFSAFATEDADDDRVLKSTLWIAVIAHALLLLINFPSLGEPEAAEPEIKRVYTVKQVRFKPPEIPKEQKPQKRVKKMPIPDPTPDEIEPLRVNEPQVDIDLPEVDTDFIAIPDAPPAPPMPDGPVFVSGDITRPARVHAPQPQYTEVARRARIQGTVIMRAVIDPHGNVTELELLKGLPMGLSDASIETAKQWKFKPATLRGKPISVYWTLTVHFKLQ